ncbi:MAG TPA: hypothetical protein DCW41_04665 [Clostridiales bacterium]|nr:hypothetical protein [Clostridiales bacterium]
MRSRKLLLCIMAVIIALQMMGASIDIDVPCSLLVHLVSADSDENYEGVSIELIPVAELTGIGLVYNDAFSSFEYDVSMATERVYVDYLTAYVEENDITGTVLTTDPDGQVLFEELHSGMYLVIEKDRGDQSEVFSPFLSILPSEDGPNVIAEPKTTAMSESKRQQITVTVTKVWNDNGKDRPESVKINLKNEDGIYDTVTITASDDWKYEWNKLPAGKNWSVEEVDVPSGYSVTYKNTGNDFTVTNTAKLVQTGIEQRPVPLLFFAGLLLLCTGVLIKLGEKKSR